MVISPRTAMAFKFQTSLPVDVAKEEADLI
jgi:hypothetical protein